MERAGDVGTARANQSCDEAAPIQEEIASEFSLILFEFRYIVNKYARIVEIRSVYVDDLSCI